MQMLRPNELETGKKALLDKAMVDLANLHDKFHDGPNALRSTPLIVEALNPYARKLLEYLEQLRICEAKTQGQEPAMDAINDEVRGFAMALLGRHANYSSEETSIRTMKFGLRLLEQYLEECVRDHESPDALSHRAILLFDADGLSNVKACIDQYDTDGFVHTLLQLFGDANCETSKWLKETHRIDCEFLSVGGDEIMVFMQSEAEINEHIMQEALLRFEAEVESHKELRKKVTFDENELMNYLNMGKVDRENFAKLSADERQVKLQEVRASLPDEFIPSVTGGSTRLDDAMLFAIEKTGADKLDIESAQTFHEAAEILYRNLIKQARERMQIRKEEFRAGLAQTDPKRLDFITRSPIVRQLERKLSITEETIENLQRDINRLTQQLLSQPKN